MKQHIFMLWQLNVFYVPSSRIQIRCCAVSCSAARGPFDYFEIRANSNLKVLTRISKWSNGSHAALHGAAQQRSHTLRHGGSWLFLEFSYYETGYIGWEVNGLQLNCKLLYYIIKKIIISCIYLMDEKSFF
jgi:hypothetical protein